ncbi:MAG: signal peptidase I [Chloroflexota bacterium]|nr:signal peptidase I [Dehalococcoidia bacterium]MDW8045701.1 signal peptidase I [Chloroflexota bacterium]
MLAALLRAFAVAAAIVGGVAAWALFAPAQFGGAVGYVVIRGNSMEPTFAAGDLVLTRVAADYRVGDVAAYRHPEVGLVVHRIVGREGDRFLFRGDNNDFTDSYHPRQVELAGRLWFHVPNAGAWLLALRQPLPFAALTALAAAGMLWPAAVPRRRRRQTAAVVGAVEAINASGGPR